MMNIKRERNAIIYQQFINGKSRAQIAREFNLTQTRVCQIVVEQERLKKEDDSCLDYENSICYLDHTFFDINRGIVWRYYNRRHNLSVRVKHALSSALAQDGISRCTVRYFIENYPYEKLIRIPNMHFKSALFVMEMFENAQKISEAQ